MRIDYYTADWCKPCIAFKPLLLKLQGEYEFDLEFIDVSDEVPPGIMSIPTLHIWKDDKKTTVVGAYPEAKIREILESV